jgi:hypothetical protein
LALIARQVLNRYPTLRGTWAVRRATAWRQGRNWQAHPRRMASWFCDTPDLHTRLLVSNLELPDAPEMCQARSMLVTLLDLDGVKLCGRRLHLERNASAVVELGEMLPAIRRGTVPSGQVIADFEGPQLGLSRAYLHWYNARSLTSSHEKFGLTIPAVGGYWTVPNVQDTDEYRVHLAVVNLDAHPYVSDVILKDEKGHELRAQMWLPANGSRFAALCDLFQDPSAFLDERPGVVYFGNNRQPAMYYYFVHNPRRGTWRVQHL